MKWRKWSNVFTTVSEVKHNKPIFDAVIETGQRRSIGQKVGVWIWIVFFPRYHVLPVSIITLIIQVTIIKLLVKKSLYCGKIPSRSVGDICKCETIFRTVHNSFFFFANSKGQIMDIFIWTKNKQKYFFISALVFKLGLVIKIMAHYDADKWLSQWFKCYYSKQSKWVHHNSWLNSLSKVTLDNGFSLKIVPRFRFFCIKAVDTF